MYMRKSFTESKYLVAPESHTRDPVDLLTRPTHADRADVPVGHGLTEDVVQDGHHGHRRQHAEQGEHLRLKRGGGSEGSSFGS